jgi:hypothetical protein
MVGRGLRLSPGKKDALVLDVMGASTRHKLASIVDLTGREAAALEEDQTLREAVEAFEEEKQHKQKLARLEFEDINLFQKSHVRWLRTDMGAWFIPMTNDLLLFLSRDDAGMYRVRRWTSDEGVRAPSPDPARPLADTMAWTEQHAKRLAPAAFVTRGARWRAGAPSDKQLAYCRRFRIQIPPGSTAGDVSDLQAIHRAGSVLRSYTSTAVAA